MERITSVQNNKIKDTVHRLSAGERRSSGLFAAEGLKLIGELAKADYDIDCCFVLEGADLTPLPSEISQDKICIVTDNVMKKLSSLSAPQSYFAVASEKHSMMQTNESFVIALDTVQDPSNMGAILRSAEAFGVTSIVLSRGCCDAFSPKCIRASMGSVLRLNLVVCELESYLTDAKASGYTIIGTGLDKNFRTVDRLKDFDRKIAVIGNEGNGISESIKNICDLGMYIPMAGQNESLNAAVAASIIMWENLRQSNE